MAKNDRVKVLMLVPPVTFTCESLRLEKSDGEKSMRKVIHVIINAV